MTPESAVVQALHAFAAAADEGTLADLGALLADDVVWAMTGTGTVWSGRGEVLAGLASMRELGHAGPDSRNRHLVTNLQVSITGPEATASSYFLLVGAGTPPHLHAVGGYRDRLRCLDGSWMLTHREVAT